MLVVDMRGFLAVKSILTHFTSSVCLLTCHQVNYLVIYFVFQFQLLGATIWSDTSGFVEVNEEHNTEPAQGEATDIEKLEE